MKTRKNGLLYLSCHIIGVDATKLNSRNVKIPKITEISSRENIIDFTSVKYKIKRVIPMYSNSITKKYSFAQS